MEWKCSEYTAELHGMELNLRTTMAFDPPRWYGHVVVRWDQESGDPLSRFQACEQDWRGVFQASAVTMSCDERRQPARDAKWLANERRHWPAVLSWVRAMCAVGSLALPHLTSAQQLECERYDALRARGWL